MVLKQGLDKLRASMAQQAEEMESTKKELRKANERAKQVYEVRKNILEK